MSSRTPDPKNEVFVWFTTAINPPTKKQAKFFAEDYYVWAFTHVGTIQMEAYEMVNAYPKEYPYWCSISEGIVAMCQVKEEYVMTRHFDLYRATDPVTGHWIAEFKDSKDCEDFIQKKNSESQ